MEDEPVPPTAPRVLHRWRAWMPSYWTGALLVLALGELLVWWRFEAAQAADRANQADGCPDECIGTWLGILFWGAMFVVWPIIWLVVAAILRWASHRPDESRQS